MADVTGVWAGLADRLATDAQTAPVPDGLWHALGERVDPAQFQPQLAPYVEITRFAMPWGNDYAIAANRRDLVYFRLEPAEADLLDQMDGTRSVGALVVQHLSDSGDLDPAAVVELAGALQQGNFLTVAHLDVDAGLEHALHPVAPRRRTWNTFLRTLSVEWSGAERLVVWLYRHVLRYAFNRIGRVIATALAIAGFVAFGAVVASHDFELTTQSVGVGFLVLMALNFAIIFIHELGHASTLVHYGKRVRGAGFRIYFGAPTFFIDSSDALTLDRGKRIAVSFAGPYFEMVASGIAAIALWAFPNIGLAPTLYIFVVLNYFVLFLNLVPLLELDGYWILSDAISLPELRPRSLAFVRHDMWYKLAHRERWSRSELGFALYGIVGVLFTIGCLYTSYFFWRKTFGDLISKMWDAGLGGRVLLALLVLFLTGPLLRAGFALLRVFGRGLANVWRQIRFRTQRRWRVEAMELLDQQRIFDDLPVETLNELAGRVTLRRVGAQVAVIRQGEPSDAYYLVRRGRLETIEEDAGRDGHLLQALQPGDGFGELGVATGSPRTATVRSVTPVQLFAIDKGSFARHLADRVHLPDFAPTLQALAELQSLRPFAHLGSNELQYVITYGAWQTPGPGERIIEQGDAGDAFYAVGSGQLEVIQDGERVRTLQPGDHFGEIALLTDLPRIATVRTLTPTRIYRLERAGFDALLKDAFGRKRISPNVDIHQIWDH